MRMPRPTYANVTATVAVVLAMTGTAVAATQINGHNIVDRSTPGQKLIKHTVTATEIKTGTLPFVAGKGLKSEAITRTVDSTGGGGTSPLTFVNGLGVFETNCTDSGNSFALVFTNNDSHAVVHYAVVKTDSAGNSTTNTPAVRVVKGGTVSVGVNNSTSNAVFRIEATFMSPKKTLTVEINGINRYAAKSQCRYSFTGLTS